MIKFFRLKEKYGSFSNFARYHIMLKGKRWNTTEHYFQAQKAVDTPREDDIRMALTPGKAAEMGRSRSFNLPHNWEKIKDGIMKEAVSAKFNQHEDLKLLLLSTGDEIIVEHTYRDSYWGDGGDGTGKNQLGKILMEVREELREN